MNRQKIFTFLSVHVPLINFIKDSQNQMAKILKDSNYMPQTRQFILELLREIYKCLTYFCKGNETNQNILSEFTDFFLDEISMDFGQMELVCSILHDNKFLCESFPESKLTQMTNFINLYGRQTRFLTLFRVIQSYKKQNLVENQVRVLQVFLPNNQSNQGDDVIDQNEFWLYGQFVKAGGMRFDFIRRHTQRLASDQPFTYHSKIIDVLLQTTMGEESFKLNSPKLKNVFRLGYLIELLLSPDDYQPDSAFDY